MVGVLCSLRDEYQLITADTPVAGASAGSLVAACSKSGLSERQLVQATLALARNCRRRGTRFRLRAVLQRFMRELLPHDIHERCSGTCHVAITRVTPALQPQLLSHYSSRDELIEALLVSCHIPIYFDGSLTTKFGPTAACDGGLTNFLPVPPRVETAVRVSCFPNRHVQHLLRHKAKGGQKGSKGGIVSIAPDVFETWGTPLHDMLRWALEPASDQTIQLLVDKGKRDARSWAELNGYACTGQQQPQLILAGYDYNQQQQPQHGGAGREHGMLGEGLAVLPSSA